MEQGAPGAGATGLEPATSGVTGRRSNRLSYAPFSKRHAAATGDRGHSMTSLPRAGAGHAPADVEAPPPDWTRVA